MYRTYFLNDNLERLMALKFEGIMEFFKELPTSIDVDQVFQVAFKLPLKRVHIEAAKEKYQRTIISK
jgi:hypothetical protein